MHFGKPCNSIVLVRIVVASILVFSVYCIGWAAIGDAKVRTVTAIAEYTMGGNETQAEAEQKAVEKAIKNAQEQINVFVMSEYKAENSVLTSEKIQIVYSRLMKIHEKDVKWSVTNSGELHVICRLTASADDAELVQAINQELQAGNVSAENKELRSQTNSNRSDTAVLRKENQQLRKKRQEAYKRGIKPKSLGLKAKGDEVAVWDKKKAISYYQQAISADKYNLEAYVALCQVNLELNDYDRAVTIAMRGTKVFPESPELWYQMAVGKYYDHNYVKALEYMRNAQRLGYESQDMWAYMALCGAMDARDKLAANYGSDSGFWHMIKGIIEYRSVEYKYPDVSLSPYERTKKVLRDINGYVQKYKAALRNLKKAEMEGCHRPELQFFLGQLNFEIAYFEYQQKRMLLMQSKPSVNMYSINMEGVYPEIKEEMFNAENYYNQYLQMEQGKRGYKVNWAKSNLKDIAMFRRLLNGEKNIPYFLLGPRVRFTV